MLLAGQHAFSELVSELAFNFEWMRSECAQRSRHPISHASEQWYSPCEIWNTLINLELILSEKDFVACCIVICCIARINFRVNSEIILRIRF